MIALALRLLPVWSWIRRNPLLCLCALLALYGAYQRHEARKWHDRAEACQTASSEARKAQNALRAQERAIYQEKADHADQEHAAALADARAATDAYIRAHRVRPSGGVGAAQPVGQAGDPEQSESLSPGLVMVAESDVQTCAAWQAYGVTAHDYLLSIGK